MLKDTPLAVGAACVPTAIAAPLAPRVHGAVAELAPSTAYTKEVPVTALAENDGAVGPLT